MYPTLKKLKNVIKPNTTYPSSGSWGAIGTKGIISTANVIANKTKEIIPPYKYNLGCLMIELLLFFLLLINIFLMRVETIIVNAIKTYLNKFKNTTPFKLDCQLLMLLNQVLLHLLCHS